MDVFTFLLDNAMLIYNFYLSIPMVQKLREPSLTLLWMLVISAAAVISSYYMAFAQGNQQQQQQPKANIINSKYLTIKDQRFRNEQFSNSITGTIVNNSTQQMESIHAYVILYDKNNRVIALENALADVSTLKSR